MGRLLPFNMGVKRCLCGGLHSLGALLECMLFLMAVVKTCLLFVCQQSYISCKLTNDGTRDPNNLNRDNRNRKLT